MTTNAEFTDEFTDFRTILRGSYPNPDRIAWPGEDFKVNGSWAEWLDVDLEPGGQPPDGVGGPAHRLDFGGNVLRTTTADIGIMRKPGAGAHAAALTTAENIVSYYTGADTAKTTFRIDEATAGRSRMWQESWWLVESEFSMWFQPESLAVPTMNQKLITQASHGFANQWLGLNGSTYVVADGTYPAVGFGQNVSTNTFMLTAEGPVTWTSHGLTVGGARPDDAIFLHVSTDGGSQDTAPAPGQRRQRLGIAIDANTIVVRIEPMD